MFAKSNDLTFGVAGDDRVVFVTQPLVRKVLVLDRDSGRTIAELPPPPAGFLLPFTVRVPLTDAGAASPPGLPGESDPAAILPFPGKRAAA